MPEARLACHLAEASRPAVQRPFPFARPTTAEIHSTTTRVRPISPEAQASTSAAQAITPKVWPSSAGRVWPTPRGAREHEIRARPGRTRQGRPIRRTGAWAFDVLASSSRTGPHTLCDRRPPHRTAHGTTCGLLGTASGIGRYRHRDGREPLADRRGGWIRGREHRRDGACGAPAWPDGLRSVRGASSESAPGPRRRCPGPLTRPAGRPWPTVR